MNGLSLARDYYEAVAKFRLRDAFPEHISRIAIGLVGAGSECFGYDDEVSRDHDFGADFCMWLTGDDYVEIGGALSDWYNSLPSPFCGFSRRQSSPMSQNRVGVLDTPSFFRSLIGIPHAPTNASDWLYINENMLATVTNGEVFCDPLGEFSKIRDGFSAYFPRDVWLKKISTAVANLSQAGQYNLHRSLSRSSFDVVRICCNEFISGTIALCFLLNRRYMPFYKWQLRAMDDFAVLGEVKPMLISLMQSDYYDGSIWQIIEGICALLLAEMQRQNLTNSNDDFLFNHVPIISSQIEDMKIR